MTSLKLGSLGLQKIFHKQLFGLSVSKQFVVKNPATLETVGLVPDFSAHEIEESIESASEALQSWKSTSPAKKRELMKEWHRLIHQNKEQLAELLTLENGKPLSESRAEIFSRALSFIEYYGEEIRRISGEIWASPLGTNRLVTRLEAIGVAALITPWNFPSSMLARKIAPALAAGCTVVAKPSAECPLSSIALFNLAIEAGFPHGIINIVTASSGEATIRAGELLTTHPKISKISFTGSTRTGRLLMKQASDSLKRVSMELGGHAPVVIFKDADIDLAVSGVIKSRFRNAGQTCICANRILIEEEIFESVLSKLSAQVSNISVGNGMDPSIAMGPLISTGARNSLLARIDKGVREEGVKIICGGSSIQPAGLAGAFMEPTLLINTPKDSSLVREELFGPVAVLIPFRDEKEAIEIANETNYGLAAYVYTENLQKGWRVAEALETGMVGVNETAISLVDAPFGGVKQSGFGREGGHEGIQEYLATKYINMKV